MVDLPDAPKGVSEVKLVMEVMPVSDRDNTMCGVRPMVMCKINDMQHFITGHECYINSEDEDIEDDSWYSSDQRKWILKVHKELSGVQFELGLNMDRFSEWAEFDSIVCDETRDIWENQRRALWEEADATGWCSG